MARVWHGAPRWLRSAAVLMIYLIGLLAQRPNGIELHPCSALYSVRLFAWRFPLEIIWLVEFTALSTFLVTWWTRVPHRYCFEFCFTARTEPHYHLPAPCRISYSQWYLALPVRCKCTWISPQNRGRYLMPSSNKFYLKVCNVSLTNRLVF